MYKDRSILVIVPARGGSRGVPLKNIQLLGGIPLLVWTARTVKQLSYVDRAIVSTDHDEIASIAQKEGLDVPFLRPGHLSGDLVGDVDVLEHALAVVEEKDRKLYDLVVMMQPTCPFRSPTHVTRAIDRLIHDQNDAVWTVSRTDPKAHPLKQLTMKGNILSFYDHTGKEIIARQQLTSLYHRNGAAYVMTRSLLRDHHTMMSTHMGGLLIEDPLVNIDTHDDFEYAEFLIQTKRIHAIS